MGSLTFRFSGVCTHFRGGIVPGVPHRVVLCDLTKFQLGGLQVIPDPGPDPSEIVQEPVLYYTTPHFAQLELGRGGSTCKQRPLPDIAVADDLLELLTIPKVLLHGDIESGVRLQIINATDVGMTGDLEGIASLRHFFPNYAPSSEVVLNGRARCYLDLFGGCSWVTPSTKEGGPSVVSIRVATDGPPKLLFTPLASSASTPQVITLPADTPHGDDFTMFVKNLEAQNAAGRDSDFHEGAYDWLLHYVTAQGGIPQVLADRPPGLDRTLFPKLPNATGHNIGQSLQIMGNALNPLLRGARRRLVGLDSVTPACADSQYP